MKKIGPIREAPRKVAPLQRGRSPSNGVNNRSMLNIYALSDASEAHPVSVISNRVSGAVICLLLTFSFSHFLTFPVYAVGLGVDPGEIVARNIPLGKVIKISELMGAKLKIRNKGTKTHTYTISILTTKETTSKLRTGYEDIPDTSWIWPEKGEVQITGNSTKEVELYLKIPKRKKYYNKKYQAIIEVKSKKDKPTDLFVLAVQPRICLSTSTGETGLTGPTGKTGLTEAVPQLVTLDLFVMSQCPWGTRAESIVYELKKRFGNRLKINLYYIVTAETQKDTERRKETNQLTNQQTSQLTFRSLHGTPEVEENMRQLLIAKYYPDRFWDYLISRNTDIRSPDWKSHALYVSINPEVIEKGMESGEGGDLLSKNIEEQKEKIEGCHCATKELPQASPTIYINNELYRGNIILPSLAVAVNNKIQDTRYKIQEIPECYSDRDCFQEGKIGKCMDAGTKYARCEFTEPARVNVTTIYDTRYPIPDKDPITENLVRRYPGLVAQGIDYESKEGRKLVKKLGINFLPAYIFDKSIEKTEEFGFLIKSKMIIKKKDYYLMASNKAREGVYLNRKRSENTLEVFSMSQCPFSIRALNGLITAQKEGKIAENVKIEIHYIAETRIIANGTEQEIGGRELSRKSTGKTGSTGKTVFRSMHGKPEVEEDMRQLCIKKYYPDKFFDYLLLRNEDIQSTLWEGPARKAGIDDEVIRECIYSKEAESLLKEDIKKAEELNINSSPTFLYENRIQILDSSLLKELPGLENLEIGSKGGCGR